MPLPPPLESRRFEILKVLYSTDSLGDDKIIGQYLFKDSSGVPFFTLPSCIQNRVLSNVQKIKISGEFSNLRQAEIEIENPNNQTGITRTKLYIPYRPTQGLTDCLLEIRQTLETKLQGTLYFCLDYRAESRFTIQQPITIREADQI